MSGATELVGTALGDIGAQCCCQTAWDPAWKQVLGSGTLQALRNNPLLLPCASAARRNLRVFHPLLKQPAGFAGRRVGSVGRCFFSEVVVALA